MEGFLNSLDFKALVEILIIAAVIYLIFNFVRGTRGARIVWGIILIIAVSGGLMLLTSEYLTNINYLLSRFLGVAVIAIIVIFQPELRRGLIRLGKNPLFGLFFREESMTLNEIVKAIDAMSKKRIGALIAIVREVELGAYVEAGVSIDSQVSAELLVGIFWPGNPLHDGAVVIQHSRITAAACLFPLTENPSLSKSMGTRHRAAIGITEETDAVTIVVSEETGTVSVCVRGEITSGLDMESLRRTLHRLMLGETGKRKIPRGRVLEDAPELKGKKAK